MLAAVLLQRLEVGDGRTTRFVVALLVVVPAQMIDQELRDGQARPSLLMG